LCGVLLLDLPSFPTRRSSDLATNFGTGSDPMVAHRIGGVNVFGGGLALYNGAHVLVGAIGVSGDSSCADHNIAWRTRNDLGLDQDRKSTRLNSSHQIMSYAVF